MPDSSVWILVADGSSAAIYANEGGDTRLLRTIFPRSQGAGDAQAARAAFAWQLATELFRGHQARAFEGFVVFGADELLKELRRLMIPELRVLLIAEISDAIADISAILPKAVPPLSRRAVSQ